MFKAVVQRHENNLQNTFINNSSCSSAGVDLGVYIRGAQFCEPNGAKTLLGYFLEIFF